MVDFWRFEIWLSFKTQMQLFSNKKTQTDTSWNSIFIVFINNFFRETYLFNSFSSLGAENVKVCS